MTGRRLRALWIGLENPEVWTQVSRNPEGLVIVYRIQCVELLLMPTLNAPEVSVLEGQDALPDFTTAEYKDAYSRINAIVLEGEHCLLYTSPSPRDQRGARMPSSA